MAIGRFLQAAVDSLAIREPTETAAPAGVDEPDDAGAGRGRKLLRLPGIENLSLLYIWGGLILLFGLLEPETFLRVNTVRTILANEAITSLMALSLIMPLAANTFDLSIGATMGTAVVVAAWLQFEFGMNPVYATLLTILVGLVIGAVNSIVIVKFRVNSFIATLGMSSILAAMIQWVSGGQFIVEGISENFKKLGTTKLFTIPLPVYYMLAVALILWYVLEHRQVGRYLYATGSNLDAARLAGVRTDPLTVVSLLVSASVATITGVIFLARIGSASLDAGPPFLLPAFASVFLGATQLKSRHVNVVGTLIAVYVLATGVKGLQLAGVPFWVDDLFNGVALIIAVALSGRAERKQRGGGPKGARAAIGL
jgi:ribose transport system permease protein